MRRIALLLEYDGTAYKGSQCQANGPSIQAELEAAINNLTGESSRAAFAGRTDAGVHALGQVAVFDTMSRLSEPELLRGLNHFLPEDVVVQEVREAPGFDPRRDATSRVYRYRIDNRPVRSPLTRGRAWHVPAPLDIGVMREAARGLEGRHNFAAFAAPYEGTTRRTLARCEVSAIRAEVCVEMEAEAFLPHQVRRTVGALVEVARGHREPPWLAALLTDAVPSSAGPAAPACGLYLVRVAYDGFAWDPSEERME
jgi:tRNA pseudouridine38-40 synthase